MKKMALRHWLSIVTFLLLQIGTAMSAKGQQLIHGTVPGDIARLGLRPIARLDSARELNFAICLPLRDKAGLTDLLRQLYNPASPNYHRWLTVQQFTSEFGPARQDYQRVIDFARTNGLAVMSTSPNRMIVDVRGTVASIERTLHIKMYLYKHPGETRTFYAPGSDPSLTLSVPISRISGLDNFSRPHPLSNPTRIVNAATPAPNAGSGPNGMYWGTDFRAA